jgi:hypothetical protein
VPAGYLWIAVPIDWVVTPSGPNQATVRSPTEGTGTLGSSLTDEGVLVIVEMGLRKEKLYWYLGHDVAPAPAARPHP